jgi:hypothetical protein
VLTVIGLLLEVQAEIETFLTSTMISCYKIYRRRSRPMLDTSKILGEMSAFISYFICYTIRNLV